MIWNQLNLKKCYRTLLKFKRYIGVFIFGLLIAYLIQSPELEKGVYYLHTPSKTIALNLEIAKTSSEIKKGLSNRSHLPKHSGMLFIFEKPKILKFWMKDTKIPLDLLYLDQNMVVQEIHPNLKPYNEETIASKAPYFYALELNAGFVRYHNIHIGDELIKASR